MKHLTVREYDDLKELVADGKLTKEELRSLRDFVDEHGDEHRLVLKPLGKKLSVQNYVGIITVEEKLILEILPKVDLSKNGEDKKDEDKEGETREIFLNMLRHYHRVNFAQLGRSDIRKLQHFNMLEVFFRLFLENLVLLTKRGLARHYHAAEDNLPYLKGRILFPQHIRANLANRACFYVEYDEFDADRPANRLIHSTIDRLMTLARNAENQQLLNQLKICFSDIPLSVRMKSDWDKHRIDRSMRHYDEVMQWVGLFLFGYGLSTFAGEYQKNQALLFPMQEIYEDFITHSFRVHQNEFQVRVQGPRKYLAGKVVPAEKANSQKALTKTLMAFQMQPDISLMSPYGKDKVEYILDAKWKRINQNKDSPKHGISQSDMYQLYAYGKRYGCKTVALVYPRTNDFTETIRYRFQESDLKLLCLPFNVAKPEESVRTALNELKEYKPVVSR